MNTEPTTLDVAYRHALAMAIGHLHDDDLGAVWKALGSPDEVAAGTTIVALCDLLKHVARETDADVEGILQRFALEKAGDS